MDEQDTSFHQKRKHSRGIPLAWILVPLPLFFGLGSCAPEKKAASPRRDLDYFQKADRASGKISQRRQRQEAETRNKTVAELEQAEEANRELAIQKYRSLLEERDKLDAETYEAILLNLGHVQFEKCLADYRRSMRSYEEQSEKYQQGQSRIEPVVPKYDFAPARETYEEFLKTFPGSSQRPQVIYNLAFSLEEEGSLDRSVALYDELVLAAPGSRLSPEAYLRLGEHFFEMNRADQALAYYQKALDAGESQFYDKALFKIGWSYYAKGDFGDAEDAFTLLLSRQAELQEKKKKDLYNESLEILAKILSETGGAKALDSLLQRHKRPAYGLDLALQLGEFFQETSRYEDAVATYEEILRRYPDSPKAPFVEQSLITCLKTERRALEADALLATQASRYGRGTPWYAQNTDPQLRKEVDTLLWTSMNNEILVHHRAARENKSPEEYEKALVLYRETIDYFPLDENLYDTRFRYAECLFESGKFKEAALEYDSISRLETFDKYKEQSAAKRVQCLEELRAQGNIDAETLISGYHDYVLLNPTNEKASLLVFKEGEVLFNDSRYNEAAELFSTIIEKNPDDPQTLRAWLLEQESLFQAARYPELEAAAKRLLQKPFLLTPEQKARTNHLLRFAQFEQARALQTAGRFQEAAARYEVIFREAPDIEIAPDALFNVAVCFKEMNDWPKASACFEEITVRYPQSKYCKDSLLAPLSYYEETGQWDRILSVADRLYNIDAGNELARESLFKIGKRYYNQGQIEKALAVLSEYKKRYPQDTQRILEIDYLAAKALENAGDRAAALQGYKQFLAAYNQAGAAGVKIELDPSYAAKAQYVLLEPRFHEYESIQLVAPLDKNLSRKQALLDSVVSDYMKTAKSGAGEYALAAAFRVGLAYEDFWESLLHSEEPAGMNQEEERAYRDLLKEQAEPYREKAIGAYRVTLDRANEKGVFNPWVLRAYSHLAQMDPQTYPPLLRDTIVWNETWKEQRILIWRLDDSRPRAFTPETAAKLQATMDKILKGLSSTFRTEETKDQQVTDTIHKLDKLLKKEPTLYEVQYDLGILYQMLGDTLRAKVAYISALKENLDLPIARLNLGILYLQEGNLQEAEEQFQKTTRLAPDYAGGWYLLGVTQNRRHACESAMASLNKAVSLLPQFLDPYVEMAMVQMAIGERDKAIEILKRVSRSPEISVQVQKKLGWCFLTAGSYSESINSYKRVIAVEKGTYGDWNNLGVAYLRKGEMVPASSALTEATKLEPRRWESKNNLGLVYLKGKNYSDASDSFRQAFSREAAKNLTPLLNLAVLYGEYLEDMKKAIDFLKEYLVMGGTVQTKMLRKWVEETKGQDEQTPQHAGTGHPSP